MDEQLRPMNTCPDVWKWNETFPNYLLILLLILEPDKVIDTVIFVEITLCPIKLCTHRRKAVLTLNPTLSLCTAKSINTTASLFSAAAVFSTRLLQSLSFECISAEENQYPTFAPESKRTFQLDILNVVTQRTQIVLLKSFLRNLRHIAIWVFIWVIRYIHFDIE